MKKLKYIAAILIALTCQIAVAQGSSKKNDSASLFNKTTNCVLRYYYYPNTEAYFDTQKKIYYYREDNEWKTAEELPAGYRGYSMYNKYSVFITDYDDDNICQFIDIHKKKYPYITQKMSKQLNFATTE